MWVFFKTPSNLSHDFAQQDKPQGCRAACAAMQGPKNNEGQVLASNKWHKRKEYTEPPRQELKGEQRKEHKPPQRAATPWQYYQNYSDTLL